MHVICNNNTSNNLLEHGNQLFKAKAIFLFIFSFFILLVTVSEKAKQTYTAQTTVINHNKEGSVIKEKP